MKQVRMKQVRNVLIAGCVLAVSCAWGQSSPDSATITPIKYVVVVFDENNSFDHYFGTYPTALNPDGEPAFHAAAGTPAANGLTPALLNRNLNSVQPFRLDRNMASTCDNDNHYADEQSAYDAGLLDKFPESTSAAGCQPGLNMGYYDGNTVTALWNYAQHFAMSDNFFDTEFGTTVMGHLNVISGQTHTTSVTTIKSKVANGSVIANVEAGFDDCVTTATGTPVQMTSANIGDLLNAKGVSWGWFYADFPQSTNNQPIPFASCPSTYSSHYDPFQYYESTSNIHHLPPSSPSAIGTSADQANHNYTVNDFWTAANNGNMPAVSFLKASKP
jgi:phospholipase C